MGFETDVLPFQLKIGDGITPWNSLPYFTGIVGPSSIALSAGTQEYTGSNFVFENSNGLSFGMNAGTLTASYNSNQFRFTSQNSQLQFTSAMSNYLGTTYTSHTHSQYLNTSQSSLFRHTSADSQLQFTSQMSDYLTSQSNQAVSAGNGSFTFQTLKLVDSGGVTFSTGTDGIKATVKTDYQTSGAYLTTAMQSDAGSNWVYTSAGLNLTNISATLGSDSVSFSVAAQSAQPIAASAANGSFNFSTLKFVDTNGVSFATSTDGVRATVKTDYQSSGAYLTTQSGQAFSAGNGSFAFQTATFADSNGVTFSTGTQGIYATVKTDYQSSGAYLTTAMQSNAATISNVNISGGTTSSNLSALKFIDSNGVSWSLDTGSKIYATVKTDYQSSGAYLTTAMQSNAATISNINVSGGTTSSNLSNFKLIDSNGVSWSLDTGSKIYATVKTDYLTTAAQSNQVVNSINGSTGIFSFNSGSSLSSSRNGNSITWGLASNITTALQSVGAYLTTADLSANSSKYVQNWKLTGNTAGTTSSAQGTDFWLAGGNGVTISGSSNTLSFSVATNYQSQGAYLTTAMQSNAATISNINVSGGTTSSNLSNFKLIDSNGVSWSLDTGSKIYATVKTDYQSSGAYLTTAMQSNAATISNINVSGGTTSSNLSNFKLIDSNGVSWSLDTGSKIYATVKTDYLTTAMLSNAATISNINISGGTTSSNLSNFKLIDSNGVSWSVDTGSKIYATVKTDYLTTAMVSDAGSRFVNTSAGLNLTNISATFNSNSISLSVAPPSAASVNISGGTTSSNLTQLKFIDSQGVSWSLDTGSKIYATVKTDYLTTAMLSNAATISNINLSAGTTSNNLSAFTLSNSNNATFGLNGSTVTISSPVSFSAGTTNNNLTNVVFSNSNNVSFGLNGSTMTASAGRASISFWSNDAPNLTRTVLLGTYHMQRIVMPLDLQANIFGMIISISNSSSAGGTISHNFGIYTLNVSTWSMASSSSGSWAYNSTLATSYTNISGNRLRTINLGTWNITPGDYMMGIGVSVATALTSGSYTYVLKQDPSYNSMQGTMFGAGNLTFPSMFGAYSAATNGVPTSIAITDIQATGQGSAAQPFFILAKTL